MIDPIGTIPVFFYATQNVPERLHRRFAIQAVLVAGGVLLLFLLAGQVMLQVLGLRFGSFQIAGGIILFLFALTMIFGETKLEQAEEEVAQDSDHLAGAVFPLAIPSIASPGAMLAVVVLTHNHSAAEHAVTVVLVLAVLAITLGLLLMGKIIRNILGTIGAAVVSRIMGIILATVAVDSVLGGLGDLGLLQLAGPDSG